MSYLDEMLPDEPHDDALPGGLWRGERRRLQESLFSESVGQLPRRTKVVIREGGSVADAWAQISAHGADCVLVTREGRLLGLATEPDILRALVAAGTSGQAAALPLAAVVNEEASTLAAGASVGQAVVHLGTARARHVVLVDREQRPVGVVDFRDVALWLMRLFPSLAA